MPTRPAKERSRIFAPARRLPSGPSADDEPLVSDIPTLVFAGRFDPITPPAWSRQVADALPNAVYLEFADHGHGMTGTCPASIRRQFVADPGGPLDLACLEAIGAPDFE